MPHTVFEWIFPFLISHPDQKPGAEHTRCRITCPPHLRRCKEIHHPAEYDSRDAGERKNFQSQFGRPVRLFFLSRKIIFLLFTGDALFLQQMHQVPFNIGISDFRCDSKHHAVTVGTGTHLYFVGAGEKSEPLNICFILRRHLNPADIGIDGRNASSAERRARHQRQIFDFQRHGAQHRIPLNPHQIVHTCGNLLLQRLFLHRGSRDLQGILKRCLRPKITGNLDPAPEIRHRCGWEKVAEIGWNHQRNRLFQPAFRDFFIYRIYQRRRKVRRHRHAMCFCALMNCFRGKQNLSNFHLLLLQILAFDLVCRAAFFF